MNLPLKQEFFHWRIYFYDITWPLFYYWYYTADLFYVANDLMEPQLLHAVPMACCISTESCILFSKFKNPFFRTSTRAPSIELQRNVIQGIGYHIRVRGNCNMIALFNNRRREIEQTDTDNHAKILGKERWKVEQNWCKKKNEN
jgi:hypothetical protein